MGEAAVEPGGEDMDWNDSQRIMLMKQIKIFSMDLFGAHVFIFSLLTTWFFVP